MERGTPSDTFNLESSDPPQMRELLASLISAAGSRSRLIAILATPCKLALATFDGVGLPILYPEHFLIADQDYVLDLSRTARSLEFIPRYRDTDLMVQAYEAFRETRGERLTARGGENSFGRQRRTRER